jgi:PAS domain-containing protein
MILMRTGAEQALKRHPPATKAGGTRRAFSPIEEFLSSQDPVWVWDGEKGRVAWTNAAGAAFWGEPDFERPRMRKSDAGESGGSQGLARMNALARSRSQKSQWIETLRLPAAGGEKVCVCCLQRLQLAGGERGVIVRALSERAAEALEEKTTKKRSARSPAGLLRETAAPLRAMAEALGGYVLLDARGLIVFASRRATRFLGRENAGLAGTAFSELLAAGRGQAERAVSRASAAAESGETRERVRPSRLEALLLQADDEPAPCRALFTPAQKGGVCVFLCDLRPGKALQRRLDARRKKAGQSKDL